MKIYGVQLDIAWENQEANFARVRDLLRRARPESGALVVLPEMFATGFSMNVPGITPSDAGEAFLAELARETGCFVLGGLATAAPDGRGRNEAFLFAPEKGNSVARYCKMHPFSFSGENNFYAPGEEIISFDWQGFSVAPFICYDLRFPEIFRVAARRGAEIFCVIANWPAPREAHWLALIKARAIENQAYVIGVNRCGDDPKLHYSGRSQIIDPRGEILCEGGNTEGVLVAEIEREFLEKYRREFPALADMRTDVAW